MPTNTFADRPASALAAPDAALKALAAGEATLDGIESVKLSSITLPLKNPDQRCQGAHRPAEGDDRGRLPVRRDPHRTGP